MDKENSSKWIVVGAISAILILTLLEFPPPLGFETRPQDNVSLLWLGFFFIILAVEVSAIPLVFKFPRLGGILGISAGVLNIAQVLADQFRLMQPEAPSFGYSLLEFSVGAVSIALIFFSNKVLREASGKKHSPLGLQKENSARRVFRGKS